MTLKVLTRLNNMTFAMLLFAMSVNAQQESSGPMDLVVPVADEQVANLMVPELTDAELLEKEFANYKELLNNNVLDEADASAKRIIEIAIRLTGAKSTQTANALINLAIVQYRNRQFDAAQQNFAASVKIIEENEDRLSLRLVNALKGLGAAQLDSGRPALAGVTYRRAVHITHVNDGPHNLSQLELLDSLAEVNLRLGNWDEAKNARDRAYALSIRHHGDDEMGLIPFLMRRASWQKRAGFIGDEQITYRRIIRIIETNVDKHDIRLIEPLLGLGHSIAYSFATNAQFAGEPSTITGELYFKRALRIAKAHPESSWEIMAKSMLDLGDYYTYSRNYTRSRKTYRDAWQLLSEDDSRLEYRQNQLEHTIAIRESSLPQYATAETTTENLTPTDQMLTASITLSYAVTSRGDVADVIIIEADPAEFTEMHNTVLRKLRTRVYRPLHVEGRAVASPDHVVTHNFLYRQADLDALRVKPDKAVQADAD